MSEDFKIGEIVEYSGAVHGDRENTHSIVVEVNREESEIKILNPRGVNFITADQIAWDQMKHWTRVEGKTFKIIKK